MKLFTHLAICLATLCVTLPSQAETSYLALTIGLGETRNLLTCSSCLSDASRMATELRTMGFEARRLEDSAATKANVLGILSDLAERTKPDDLCVIYFSGHGGWKVDQNADEVDGMDETWELYDGFLLDDELNEAWAKFKKGVCILFISDSCNSATVFKEAVELAAVGKPVEAAQGGREKFAIKAKPPTAEELKARLDMIVANKYSTVFPVKTPETAVECSMISFAACEDGGTALMGNPMSAFTTHLLETMARWRDRGQKGTYAQFFGEIVTNMKQEGYQQQPQLSFWGIPHSTFQDSQPFEAPTIQIETADLKPPFSAMVGNTVTVTLPKSSGPVHSVKGEILKISPDALRLNSEGGIKEIPFSKIESLKKLGATKERQVFDLK